MGNLVPLHESIPEKNIYFNDFSPPPDAASILKNPRMLDAASEPENVNKLIENYFFKCICLTSKK